jgi:hypothetical protein
MLSLNKRHGCCTFPTGSATTLETFNALKGSICQVLGDIARVAPEWVEVQATAAATARRRRRSLLQSDANPALIVKAKIHTDDVEGVRAGVLAAISDGSLAQRLAATTPAWTLQAESVQVATQARAGHAIDHNDGYAYRALTLGDIRTCRRRPPSPATSASSRAPARRAQPCSVRSWCTRAAASQRACSHLGALSERTHLCASPMQACWRAGS